MDKNKPWAVLKVNRRQYETARPWKRCHMERRKFEAMLLSLPEGFVDHVLLESDAEKLVRALFVGGNQ